MGDNQTVSEKVRAMLEDVLSESEKERFPDGTATVSITDETGLLYLRQLLASGEMQAEGYEPVEFEVAAAVSSGDLIIIIEDATYRIALRDIMQGAMRYHIARTLDEEMSDGQEDEGRQICKSE